MEKPKGGYHPKKSSGWGAVIGIIFAFLLALFMLHRGVRHAAMHSMYFAPHIQQNMENPDAVDGMERIVE
ncbi:MAG: hypothetical protein FWE24_10650 [Defluviitaleaceae bacterium]|nr:hypothetical protein [Defluviitaleaceae bacterium]